MIKSILFINLQSLLLGFWGFGVLGFWGTTENYMFTAIRALYEMKEKFPELMT